MVPVAVARQKERGRLAAAVPSVKKGAVRKGGALTLPTLASSDKTGNDLPPENRAPTSRQTRNRGRSLAISIRSPPATVAARRLRRGGAATLPARRRLPRPEPCRRTATPRTPV